MTFKSLRWGHAVTALVLVGTQGAACSSPATKKVVPPFEEAGAGGEVSTAGQPPVAGSSGQAPVGGAPGAAGTGNEDAGAAGSVAGSGAVGGDQGGVGNSAGTANTAGSSAGGGTGGTAGSAGNAGTAGSAGNAGTAGSAGNAGTAGGGCTASPDSTITTAATAVHGDTLVAASVPAQANVTYAWSVIGNGGTVNGSANKNTVAFDVGATGTEVALQVTVTSTSSACASTSVLHIPIPCQVPTLVSADGQPAVAHYIPNNEDTGHFDMTGSGNIWAAYLSAKSATASYNGAFNHFTGTAWLTPVASPLFLNDTAAARLLYYKVATDNAGDAVFAWTQTTDNNTYSVMVSAYRAGNGTWTTPQLVGTVFNQETPVDLKLNRSTGATLIAWAGGPYGSVIPHLRSYTPSTDTLGADLALRPSTTNSRAGDGMNLSLETNDALSGFMAWFEHDGGTNLDALYALHLTNGAPDTVASAYDIKQLAVGTANFTTDTFNFNSVYNVSASRQPRIIAVSAAGNGAVVWGVYNGLATPNRGQLYVRRYTSGTWSAQELVAAQGPGFSSEDWGIDDAGNVLINVWTNNVGYDFYAGAPGSAWSAVQHLSALTGSASLPHLAVDSVTGKGIATFRDSSLAARAPLRGVFYDPTTHALSAAFTIDDPQQSGGEGGRVHIDGTGLVTVLYTQMPKVLPGGANSSNSSLLFSTTCK